MKENQKINCDVCACIHQDKNDGSCKLKSITVIPADDIPTAHYCGDYKEK
ncbi:MAG TPA: hypothetical protein PK675_04340 [Clostridia bacterium]|nr:hypothetical protein [Clostridia bacterium]